jgi:hypothetical protein
MAVEAAARQQIGALDGMTVRELRAKWREVFGEETRCGNRLYLVRRIAWRIQADAEGDLTEGGRQQGAQAPLPAEGLALGLPRARINLALDAPLNPRLFRAIIP